MHNFHLKKVVTHLHTWNKKYRVNKWRNNLESLIFLSVIIYNLAFCFKTQEKMRVIMVDTFGCIVKYGQNDISINLLKLPSKLQKLYIEIFSGQYNLPNEFKSRKISRNSFILFFLYENYVARPWQQNYLSENIILANC